MKEKGGEDGWWCEMGVEEEKRKLREKGEEVQNGGGENSGCRSLVNGEMVGLNCGGVDEVVVLQNTGGGGLRWGCGCTLLRGGGELVSSEVKRWRKWRQKS